LLLACQAREQATFVAPSVLRQDLLVHRPIARDREALKVMVKL
jgi:hypothetical protein